MSTEAEVVAIWEAKEVDKIITAEVAITKKQTSVVEVAILDNMMEIKIRVAKINTSKIIIEVEVEVAVEEVDTTKTVSRWKAKIKKENILKTIMIRETTITDSPSRLVEALILSLGIEYPVARKTLMTIFRLYRKKAPSNIKNIIMAIIVKKDININTEAEEDSIRKEVENIVVGATEVVEVEAEELMNLEKIKKINLIM